MWLKWLPWKFAVRWLARRHGFLDPIVALSYLRRFAQPSEVGEPIELLRAGVVFHARGLMNARAIQHNLDWVWPYWVERQFDPEDASFVPRAFSITHINLTHRNWTAVGIPDIDALPIVDPRGLVTPNHDGWSIDAWIVADDGRMLAPSELKPPGHERDERGMTHPGGAEPPPARAYSTIQSLELPNGVAIATESRRGALWLRSETEAVSRAGIAHCEIRLTAECDTPAWLVVALRPCNPEGVSFIHRVELDGSRRGWQVEGKSAATFSEPADRHAASTYREGDVAVSLLNAPDRASAVCDVGMATAAALFKIGPGAARRIEVRAPMIDERGDPIPAPSADPWPAALRGCAALLHPDPMHQSLYDIALRTLVLHSPLDVYPGPYTYKRFWFRDAAIILHGLLCAGLLDRAERCIDRFPSRQTMTGYFLSQEGEWDSNGEALWIMRKFCELAGRAPKDEWLAPIRKGARWIAGKRLPAGGDSPHAGLLPAGFSAEHLGPNDYYYWDDFWGVAGLRSAAAMLRQRGEASEASELEREADAFMAAIDRSLDRCAARLGSPAMPASPHRRLDAGAIGSIAAGYPLQLVDAADPRLLGTAEFLLKNCSVRGGFFQDMIHSGINPYLTLELAQVMMRAGDPRASELIEATAAIASPTGQWPEAVHPLTLGGCMGDGQHVWAAAEWVLAMRNSFMAEEERAGTLVLGAGISDRMLASGEAFGFGPAPTIWGPVAVSIKPGAEMVEFEWSADWRGAPPKIEIRLPGREAVLADPRAGRAAAARRCS